MLRVYASPGSQNVLKIESTAIICPPVGDATTFFRKRERSAENNPVPWLRAFVRGRLVMEKWRIHRSIAPEILVSDNWTTKSHDVVVTTPTSRETG